MMTLFFHTLSRSQPNNAVRLFATAVFGEVFSSLLMGTPSTEASTEARNIAARQVEGGEPPDDLKGLRDLQPEAITQIHNRYFPDVFRFVRYRLGDETLAEDITGETFTRLLEYASRKRGPNKNVRGWLMRTASNLVNDHYRAQYSKPTETLKDSLVSDVPDPFINIEANEEKQALSQALKKLTEEQVNVLALRFGSGLSLAETASALGKKPNAIKALQFRAIGALRRHLLENTNTVSS